MDEPLRWMPWAWVIIAIVFTIAEIFTAGFFLICFGVGGVVAAAAGFLGVGPLLQFGIFIAVSSLTLALLRPLADRFSRQDAPQIGIERLLGMRGVVVETIDPNVGRGVVRVDHERWSALSSTDTPIMAGTHITVTSIEGAHLRVEIAPDPAIPTGTTSAQRASNKTRS